MKTFDNPKLVEFAECKSGIMTGSDSLFTRFWYEVNGTRIDFYCNHERFLNCNKKWFPINTGGFRKWYGNLEMVINLLNDGFDIKNKDGNNYRLRERKYYFQEGIVWSELTSGMFSSRYCRENTLFFASAPLAKTKYEVSLYFLLGLMNSKYASFIYKVINPTFHYNINCIESLPVNYKENTNVDLLTRNCISISREDWDSFETYWDFAKHPLVLSHYDLEEQCKSQFAETRIAKLSQLEWHYKNWESECEDRFNQLKANEEELNRIFIDIYGLKDELTPEVEDKDVTVRKADLQREIKSLLSYAVGCMFGRYSLDVEGLAYAGGEWDDSKYSTFVPDADNVIPITDDEYFEDDIVGRFINWLKVVYGEETLEENLQFIANALGGRGSAREVIRKYFVNDFFNDHCKIYQKRPIYWLFDSGKKNGFKALIYMHRYAADTIARIRTDYVHEQQARYRTILTSIEQRLDNASTAERVKINKELALYKDKEKELHDYEEKIHHLADQMISIDLDDGVKNNYAIFGDVLAKIK